MDISSDSVNSTMRLSSCQVNGSISNNFRRPPLQPLYIRVDSSNSNNNHSRTFCDGNRAHSSSVLVRDNGAETSSTGDGRNRCFFNILSNITKENFATLCLSATMCVVIFTVVVVTVVIYIRVEYLIEQSTDKKIPYVDAGLEDVSSVLRNGVSMSKHATHMAEKGDVLVSETVPKLISMLNTTQRMVNKFERFSSQPSINIGVG